jgi:tRNA pseudouridine13 synthase
VSSGGPTFDDPLALTPEQMATPEMPGLGGVIKQREEDFLVEELPLYDPAGEGEHLYLFVEKQGLSTSAMIDVLRRHFGVRERDIGFAGMKDKAAITRQVVSVHTPGRTDADFPMLQHERVRILWTDLHTNKLRVGHLRGNRFSIRLRDVDPLRVIEAQKTMRLLAQRGVPNLYGEQRFGARLNNHELGRLLLRREFQALLDLFLGPDEHTHRFDDGDMRRRYQEGDHRGALEATPASLRNERAALRALAGGASVEEAVHAVPALQLRFWASSFQSAIFNRVVADRMAAGDINRLHEGDVAMRGRKQFDVTAELAADPETQRRLDRFEIAPAGPIWGPKTRRTRGDIHARERDLLEQTGVTLGDIADFDDQYGGVAGTRRPLRVPLVDPEIEGGVDEHGSFIRVGFELPPGSFATVVIRELTKRHPAHDLVATPDDEGEA